MATRAQITRALTLVVEDIVSQIGSKAIPALRDATPKDTRYHSSRWVGRAGGPPARRTTPAGRAGRAIALSFSQQDASITALRNYRLVQGNIFIINDGNYIGVLDRREGRFVDRELIALAARIQPRRVIRLR